MGELILRVDDFPGTRPNEFYRHNLKNFMQFNDVMKECYLSSRYILGVIPRYVGAEEFRWLKDQENITLAMHGIDHSELPNFENEFQRFMSLGIEEREHAIEFAVRRELCRFEEMAGPNSIPNIYIPPHNKIDLTTLEVLLGLQFKTIMGGPGSENAASLQDIKKMCELYRSTFIYSSSPLEYGRTDELLQRFSAQYIANELGRKDICLTLHWTWEWNIGFDHLRKYFDCLSFLMEGIPT